MIIRLSYEIQACPISCPHQLGMVFGIGFASVKSWWRLVPRFNSLAMQGIWCKTLLDPVSSGCLTLSHVAGAQLSSRGSEQPVLLCDQKSTKILTYPKIWKSRIQTVQAMINNGVPGSVKIQCNLAKVGAMEPRRLVLVSILHVDSRSDWPYLWFPSYLQAPGSCDWDISAFGIMKNRIQLDVGQNGRPRGPQMLV